ncbi:MAG: phosphatidylglycerophosphatase A [Gammaproteobacteria bacterium]
MKRNRLPPSVWRNPVHFLACGFGSGAAPVAPGTFGTLAAVPLYLLLQPLPVWVYLAIVTLMFFVGVQLCEQTAADFGVHDHGGIVWDEIVGFLMTMIVAPDGWLWVIVGFLLFRFFDIVKPWPIRRLDREVQGGLGIMVDDALAGIYGAVVIAVLVQLIGS